MASERIDGEGQRTRDVRKNGVWARGGRWCFDARVLEDRSACRDSWPPPGEEPEAEFFGVLNQWLGLRAPALDAPGHGPV